LAVNPLRDPHFFNPLHIAGSWAITQPIQSMYDGLVFGEVRGRQPFKTKGLCGITLLRIVDAAFVTAFSQVWQQNDETSTQEASKSS
jgi:hypothetical protein